MTSGSVVLIGMPASGKSTVGVLAAKAFGLDFVDTDLLLQKQEGLRLHEILQRNGAEGFLSAENRLLSRLTVEGSVISTGGSVIYHAEGMKNLKAHGAVVWLEVPFAEIERRLSDITTRGVVLASGQTLRDLYEERQPLYEKWADFKLSVDREDLETTVNRLLLLLKDP